MKFVRAGAEVKVLDVFADDRVAVAMAKLENFLGDQVYMWTERAVTPHEALGMVVEHTDWSRAEEAIDGARAAAALAKLLGVRVKAPKTVTRLWVVDAVRGKPLAERLACAFRYITIGGYFADHGVDPLAGAPRPFAAENHGVVDTSQMLMESFGAEVFHVATRRDVEMVRADLVDRYRFKELGGDLTAETLRYNDLLSDPRGVKVVGRTVTYAKVSGECVFRAPGIDTLMTAFADIETTPDRPMIRLGNHSLGTVLTRIHESFVGSAEIDRYIVSSRKNFVQALIAIPGTAAYAFLEVFPDRFYLSARFSIRDTVDSATFARVFPVANELLRRVSPYYVPVTDAVFRSDYVNNSTKLSGYRAALVDMWFAVEIVSDKKLCDTRTFYKYAIDGGPIVKPINLSRDDRRAFLQFVRANNVSKEALVRNFIVHNAGASATTLTRRVTADYGVSAEDAAEMIREFYEFNRFSVARITTVRVDRQSASRVALTLESVSDERHAHRIANAVAVLFDECTRGAAGRRVVASVDVVKSISVKVQSKIGDIDEFMDLVNISEPGLAGDAADELEVGDSGMGSDVLRALQQRDPAVFAFRAAGVFRPYSVQCQDRQPTILTDEELERAAKGSSEGSFKGVLAYGSDRKHNFICPQKWCVTSKVARRKGERCPLPAEPEHVFGDLTYPGYISGSKHPAGLCMPCCFKKEPVPGSKVFERKALCENPGAAAAAAENANAPAPGDKADKADKADAPLKNTFHLSRADRILDFGFFGKIPDALAAHFPAGFVRRGMGTQTAFFDAVEFVVDDPKFHEKFAANLAYHNFLAGDPRRFAGKRPAGDANSANSLNSADSAKDAAAFAAWWKSGDSATYRTVFSLKPQLSPKQAKRERAAFALFRGAAVARGDDHDAWTRPINSFTPSAYPHVVVVSEAADGVASVTTDEIRRDRRDVAFVLHRAGRYEPLGYINNREFTAAVAWTQPWVRKLVDAQEPPPAPPGARRVLAGNYLVTAVLFPGAGGDGNGNAGGILALPRPLTFNPKYPHVHLSDVPPGTRVAHREAKKLRDKFYDADYVAATETILADADIDFRLFVGEDVPDRRADVLRDVNAKAEAEGRYAKAVWDVIGDDPLVAGEAARAKETAARIAALRKKYAAKLPDLPVYITDYIIERLLRPVGVATVPVINKRDDEVIVSAIK